MKAFHGLDHEVAQVGVEADRPAVEEAFIPEETEWQALVENEIDAGVPRVVEGLQPKRDRNSHGWPRAAEELDPNPTLVWYVDRKCISHATREDRSGRACVDEGLRRDAQAARRQLDIDGRTQYPLTSGEGLLLTPSEDLEATAQGQPAPTMKASEEGRTYSMTASARFR